MRGIERQLWKHIRKIRDQFIRAPTKTRWLTETYIGSKTSRRRCATKAAAVFVYKKNMENLGSATHEELKRKVINRQNG